MATYQVRSSKGTVARIVSAPKRVFRVTSASRGPSGENAYQLAVRNGFVGTLAEYLDSLEGAPGDAGSDGQSAYQTWLTEGNTGDEEAFLESLRGPDGDIGPAGPGVPAGGAPGQLIGKASSSDYDTAWIDPPSGGGDGDDLRYVFQRGVSLSGMEFGKDQLPGIPGTNYNVHREEDFAYYASKGFTVVRLAILWERLQPILNGGLDPTYKGFIDNAIQYAKNNGMKIILEPHNYARRDVAGTEYVIGEPELPISAFANFWGKVALAYKNEPGIFMYDLMNEPHDMPIPMSGATYNPDNDTLQFIVNTSFEADLTGWQLDGSEFSVSTEQAYDGTKSIKQVNTDGYGSLTTPSGIDLLPYTQYVLTFYHRTQADFDYQTSFVEVATGSPYAAGGTILASAQTNTIGTEFVRFALPFTTGGDAKVYLRVHGNGAPTTAYYDAFNLTQGATAIPYTTESGNGTVATVTAMNQAAINAIRSVDLNKWIALEFDRYSGLQSFPLMFGGNNPTKWWTDPANKTMISFHYYFDSNQEGTYLDPYSSAYRTRIATQIAPALDWAAANNVKVYIGEYGVINADTADGANWRSDMDLFLDYLDDAEAYATHWAGGQWYGSITTIQPEGAFYGETDFSVDRAQMPVIAAHPSKLVGGGGEAVWGGITGDIDDQADLQSALDAKATSAALTSGLAGKANTVHTHVIADTTSLQSTLDGKLNISTTAPTVYGVTAGGVQANIGYSSSATAATLAYRTTGGVMAVGTPTQGGHAATKTYVDAGDTALQTNIDSKANTVHTHAAADITSGIIAPARLGTGTADSTTYLRGDGTYATPAGGGGGGSGTVTSVTSANSDLTVATTTTTPVITVVSAPKLTTARTINGVSFDGTGNITVADATKMANPMTTAGDIIVGGASGAPTRLAASATANRVLTVGLANSAPVYGLVSLTAMVSGILAIANGGTGRNTSTTAYGLIAAGTTATGVQQTIAPGTAGQFLKSAGASALASFATITKADVGLSNVDNTADSAKPISTATQAALNGTTEDTAGATFLANRTNYRGSLNAVSGTVYYYGFTAGVTKTISRFSTTTSGTGGSGLTLVRQGLYTYDSGTGALTLVASTPNVTTGFTSAYNGVQTTLTTPYQIVAGTRYMFGVIIVGTTPPSMVAVAGADDYSVNGYYSGVWDRVVGYQTGQTDLPSSVTNASMSDFNQSIAGILLV